MEKRLRLDVPSLSDPVTRDLFQESDLFVRSFSGMTSLGLLSPFDFVSILTLTSEIISHLYVIYTLTNDPAHVWVLLFSIASAFLPFILPWLHAGHSHPDSLYSPQEAQAAEKQEKMRHLAHNDSHRPELLLFGLGPWILDSWAQARKSLLGLEKPNIFRETAFLGQVSLNEIMVAVQHVRNITIHSSFAKAPVLTSTAFHFFPHADTTSDHDAVIVGNSGFLYVVQDLHSILGLLHQKFDQHGQARLPGCISDGGLLLRYGLRAKVGAKEGPPYPIQLNREGNEDRGEVRARKLPLFQTWKEHPHSKISLTIETYHIPTLVVPNPPSKTSVSNSRPERVWLSLVAMDQVSDCIPAIRTLTMGDGLCPRNFFGFTSCLLSSGTPLDQSI